MDILDFCVERLQALKADKFELVLERSSSVGVEIKDAKLDHLSRSTDQGLAIRTLKNQRMGFSYTFDLSRDAVETAVRRALEIGELMPADALNDLIDFKGNVYPTVENFDQRGLEVPLERKIDIAMQVEADAKRHDPRIKRVRKAGFDELQGETVMVDSNGRRLSHRATLFAAELLCVAEAGNDAETGYDSRYSSSLEKLEYQKVGAQAAKEALEGLGGGAAQSRTCPVVLKNSVVGQLLGFLASSFSAENIDKNFSLLVGKKGERLFSEKITILDDGVLEGGTATSPFDGEGNPTRTTTLVEAGVIRSYLYDSYYARKHGAATTGNSRRGSLKSGPGVGPTNLYLKAGTRSLEALVAQCADGIYLTDLLGLHTANPVTGEFSVGASGILIEGGKLTRPVKGFAIAGSLVDLLRDAVEVGSDIRFWGSVGTPSLLVSKLAISGS